MTAGPAPATSGARRSARFRRAVVATTVVFAVALAAVLTLCVALARIHADRELGSRAQEAATGLSKAIETAMDDPVLVDTLVTAAFDRGYFAAVTVVSRDGRWVSYKETAGDVTGVPRWFTRLAALAPPVSEAKVTLGWRQLGRVVVVSHPHFAILQLWHTVLGVLAVMLSAYIGCIAVLHRALHMTRAMSSKHQRALPSSRPLADRGRHALTHAAPAVRQLR